jgi:hypothetical protein
MYKKYERSSTVEGLHAYIYIYIYIYMNVERLNVGKCKQKDDSGPVTSLEHDKLVQFVLISVHILQNFPFSLMWAAVTLLFSFY